MVAAMLQAFLMVIVFVWLQCCFVLGLSAGAVKG
jgi:ABC-type maltose transport system permease subunit